MPSNQIDWLATPPRSIPLPLACAILLKGVGTTIGAAFLIMGLAFALIFGSGFNPIDEVRLHFSPATAEGRIVDVAPTNASVNEEPVYQYEFTFRTPDEQEITGYGYTTGRQWRVEERVLVHYVPTRPTVATIEEARRSLFPPWAFLLTLLFPAVGAALFLPAQVRGLRQIRLLRHGQLAATETLIQQATNVSINDVPVMRYVYEFQARDGGIHEGSCRALPSRYVGDEESERVLYLPSNPSVSVLVDALPLHHPLYVDRSGDWVTHEGRGSVGWYGLIATATAALVVLFIVHLLGLF